MSNSSGTPVIHADTFIENEVCSLMLAIVILSRKSAALPFTCDRETDKSIKSMSTLELVNHINEKLSLTEKEFLHVDPLVLEHAFIHFRLS